MKNSYFIGLVLLISCDDRGQYFDHSDVVGNYKLTEWNAPEPVDWNQDGASSRNLLDESDCFKDASISINEGGKFTKAYRSLVIGQEIVSCQLEIFSGIWTRTGHRLTLTWDSGEGMISDIYNFGSVNNILTRTIEDCQYPSIGENGEPKYEVGHVNVVFTKIN